MNGTGNSWVRRQAGGGSLAWTLLLVVALLGVGVLPGCSGSDGADGQTATVTYYCLETHKVFELKPQKEVPATNPETGRKTLVPAYRDPKTNEWRPLPQALREPR